MLTRRTLLATSLATGAGLALPPPERATAQNADAALERNKAVVRRFKESQGTKDEAQAMREVLAPNYKRWRAGFEHIGANARDQDFPGPGSYLRGAFPDLRISIEDTITDGDKALVRAVLEGTHKGSELGVPPTGRRMRVQGMVLVRIANGQIVEGWNSWDQLGLLRQTGALPEPEGRDRFVAAHS